MAWLTPAQRTAPRLAWARGTRSLGGVSPTAAPKVCGCGVLPGAGGGRRVLGCSCTPRQEPRGVQEHAQIKGRI